MTATTVTGLRREACAMLAGLGLHNVEFDESENHGGGMLAVFQCRYPIRRVTEWRTDAATNQTHADTGPETFVLDSRQPASRPEVYSQYRRDGRHAMVIQGVTDTVDGIRRVAGSLWIGAAPQAPRDIVAAFDRMTRRARAELLIDDLARSAEALLANGEDALPHVSVDRIKTIANLSLALDRVRRSAAGAAEAA